MSKNNKLPSDNKKIQTTEQPGGLEHHCQNHEWNDYRDTPSELFAEVLKQRARQKRKNKFSEK